MQKYSPVLFLCTGIVHNLVGIIKYWGPLTDIFQSGLVNSVVPHTDRLAIFWFLIVGFMMMCIAQLFKWILDQGLEIPRFAGWFLLILGLIGVVFIPKSGFWLVIPQGWMLLQGKDDTKRYDSGV